MCLLIVNPSGTLTREQFSTAWTNNPHGGGFVYIQPNGKMKVRKTQKGAGEFFSMYEEARTSAPDSVFIVHFRWATHGKKRTDNTHPFKIWDGLYFAHNGIIGGYGSHDVSDTRDFGQRILAGLPDKFYLNTDYKKMLADHIGHNKLAFLDSENNFAIVGEKLGTWEKDGNWYSNDGHKPKKYDAGFFNRYAGASADAYDDYGWPQETSDTPKKGKSKQKSIGYDADRYKKELETLDARLTKLQGKRKHLELKHTQAKSYNRETKQMEACGMCWGHGAPVTDVPLDQYNWAIANDYYPVMKDGQFKWCHKNSGTYYSKDWPVANMKWTAATTEKI